MATLCYKVVMSAIGSDSSSHDTLQYGQLAHSEHVLLLPFRFVSLSIITSNSFYFLVFFVHHAQWYMYTASSESISPAALV